MKKILCLLATVVAFAGTLIGCGVRGSVDTSKLEKGFQSSAAKADISQAITAIKSGEFAKAVPVLQKVIRGGGLTDEQKDGISSTLTGMQIVVSRNPNKYSVDVYNALSDLVALAEGREPVSRPPPK